MFNKLSVKSIVIGYKKNFEDKNNKILYTDKIKYFYLPYLIGFTLCLIKLPDENLTSLLSISLSIFIGFFLSTIAVLLALIGNKKIEINYSDQKLRLGVLKETIYNILYAILQSINSLIFLYLLHIISFDDTEIGEIFYIIFERNIDFYIQFVLSLLLYRSIVSLIFSFYMIIKNITTLFKKDIEIELFNIRQEENKK